MTYIYLYFYVALVQIKLRINFLLNYCPILINKIIIKYEGVTGGHSDSIA